MVVGYLLSCLNFLEYILLGKYDICLILRGFFNTFEGCVGYSLHNFLKFMASFCLLWLVSNHDTHLGLCTTQPFLNSTHYPCLGICDRHWEIHQNIVYKTSRKERYGEKEYIYCWKKKNNYDLIIEKN